MPSSVRIGLVAALAIACHGASAQTTTVPPAITVQRIAPQLVQFVGSQANFQNLVSGLAQGTPVQLFTALPDGSTQIVTFTPAAPLPADQIAQALERARQQLIGLGIATPTGEQVAIALTGGTVPTALGGSQVTGALPATPPAAAVQAQTSVAAGATGATTSTTPLPTTPVNVQLVPATTPATTSPIGTASLPRANTSDSPLPAGATSRSPTPPAPVVTSPPAVTPGPTPAAAVAAPGTRPPAGRQAAVAR
jgi:hypothetical protein